MHNPFQLLTEAFHPQYRVNLSIERLDGSIMLTLSEEQNVVAKRLISPAQRNDERRLRNVIRSLQQTHRTGTRRRLNQPTQHSA